MSSLALHPEAVPDDPLTVRWVVPAATVPFIGEVGDAPGDLGHLIAEGTLTAVRTEPAAVVTTLREGRRWRADGARVRNALSSALSSDLVTGGWRPRGSTRTPDETLLAMACELADGPAGAYVRSHGGDIEVLGACNGVLDVRLSGTCHGCPAKTFTLTRHLDLELRRRCPHLVEVRNVG